MEKYIKPVVKTLNMVEESLLTESLPNATDGNTVDGPNILSKEEVETPQSVWDE